MKKFSLSELESMSLDTLILMLNPDYKIGATTFPSRFDADGNMLPSQKRWIVEHNYAIVADLNQPDVDVNKWVTFGLPVESIQDATCKPSYGATPKKALINFYLSNPTLII